ncbi:MAG: Gfo/Idh/MocA family protein [Pelagibaca sp.]
MTDKTLLLLGAAHVHLPDHLRHIDRKGWRVTHVHDRDPDRRDTLCTDLGARPLTDLDGIAGTGCTAAVVCSETAHHEADILAALDVGLPVFSEKPLAGGFESAQRCAERARERGLLLHTGYFFRTNAALQRLKSELDAGHIGSVIAARMRFSHDGGYADWLDLDCWMTDPKLACYDGFVDEAVHVIDMLQWLIGPITHGSAVTGNALGWRVDDHGAAVVTFENGATGVIEAGWTDTEMRFEIDLVGTEGAARISDDRLTLTRRGTGDPSDPIPLSPLDAGEGIVPFLDALEGENPPALVPPEAAISVNALLDAMGLNRA